MRRDSDIEGGRTSGPGHGLLRSPVRWLFEGGLSIGCVCVLAMVAPGCHDAAYEADLARRQKNLHDLWTTYATSEEDRPMRLERMMRTADDLQKLYQKRLDASLDSIDSASRRRMEAWLSNESIRQEQLEQLLAPRPDRAEEAWRTLRK